MACFSADTPAMSEGPYPNVPALTGPVSGIPALGAIGAQPRRPDGKRRVPDKDRPADEAAAESPLATQHLPAMPPPRDPLIEALDRLRATHPERDERAADTAVLRLLRAKQLYREVHPAEPPPMPPTVD